jgi:UrcA family protein
MRRTTSIITALILAAVAVSPVLAGDLNEVTVISATVKLGDLNLSDPRDAGRAIDRIARKARNLCAPEGGSSLRLGQSPWEVKCEAAAVRRAVAQLNVPAVSLALGERLDGAEVRVAQR